MLTEVSIHSARARVACALAPKSGHGGAWLRRGAEWILTFVRMTRRGDWAAHEAGFSLVEALIALAIIAAMTAALVGTVAADAHARFAVAQRRQALLIAQSALARAVGGEAVDGGRGAGPGPQLAWRIERQPYAQGEAAFAPTRLERLTVIVSDADGHPLAQLATARIVP